MRPALATAALLLLPALAAGGHPSPRDWMDEPSSSPSMSVAQVEDQSAVARMTLPSFGKVWFEAFSVVGVAEIFDKTWFVTLLASTRCGAQVSFLASFLALAVHTAVAACLGAAFSSIFPVWTLHFATAAVFVGLALAYAFEYWRSDHNADAFKTRAEEAREVIAEEGETQYLIKTSMKRRTWAPLRWADFSKVFFAVFVAEWGDRTQIAMLSLHSSLAITPVVLGSLTAFGFLSLTAVMVASLLKGKKLSEKFICAVSSISFVVFALLAVHSGVEALRADYASKSAGHGHGHLHSRVAESFRAARLRRWAD